MVHGPAAAVAAEEAAGCSSAAIRPGRPSTALELVAGEVETFERTAGVVARHRSTCSLAVGLAASKSDARRLLAQQGYRANGVVLAPTASLAEVPPLHGRFVLLRPRRKTHRLVRLGVRRPLVCVHQVNRGNPEDFRPEG